MKEVEPVPAKRIGRPPGSTRSDRADMIRVRVSPEQRAKFERLGGADWLRERIDKTRG